MSARQCLCCSGQPDTRNRPKLSTAVDLISPSTAAEGPSRRQARKQKRRVAERRAQQQQQAEAAAYLPSVSGSQLGKGDAVRRGQTAANGTAAKEQGLAPAQEPFASLPAAIVAFVTQQGFIAPTEIQMRCAAFPLISAPPCSRVYPQSWCRCSGMLAADGRQVCCT